MQACEQKLEEVARSVRAREAGSQVPQEAQRTSRSLPAGFRPAAAAVAPPGAP